MKNIYISLLLITFSLAMQAQTLSVDSLFSRMEQQALLYPSERLYLHTDRSSYIAGEKVWIKAYVVDGITNIPNQKSRYVFVTF